MLLSPLKLPNSSTNLRFVRGNSGVVLEPPDVLGWHFRQFLSHMLAKCKPIFSLLRSPDGWVVAFVLIDSSGKVGTLLDDTFFVEVGHIVGRDFGDGFPGVLAKVEAVWFATRWRL